MRTQVRLRWLLLLLAPMLVPALAQRQPGLDSRRQAPNAEIRPSNAQPLHPCGLLYEDPRTIPWMIQDTYRPSPSRRLSTSGDISSQMPPVGNQGTQGSCAGWAIGYYQKTHYEYREHHWNDSTSNHQFSPAFIYNQINGGVDAGAYFSDAYKLMDEQGCASLSDCSYNQNDYTTWPSESAFARAIPYRDSGSHYFAMTDTNAIKAAKVRIDSGVTTVVGIYVYSNFDNIQNYGYKYCVADTYGGNRGGHAITIVGYNDTITTSDGKGAFRFVNSWGTGWGQSGYAWMSYVAVMSSRLAQGYGYYLIDRTGYSPTLIGRVKITHSARDLIHILLGVGQKSAPKWTRDFRNFYMTQQTARAFPNNNIVFDMSEGASYITGGQTDSVFVRARDSTSDGKTGTINYYSATLFPWNSTGVSPDTPVTIPDTGSAYARARILRSHDVGVTAILAPTGVLDSGTVVTPKARVKNFGGDTATFRVKFRIGSIYADSQSVSNLLPGDSVQVSFTNWTASQRGTYTTRCTTALSNDSNHTNDTLSGTVRVKVTNVGVTALVAPTGTVDSGTVVTPKARVKNFGTDAATFPVTFRIGSGYTNTQTVTNLASGDSIQVSFLNWTATQRGTSATRCSTALTGDQVRSNDTLSGTVRVKVTNVGVTALVAPSDTVDSGTVVTPKSRVKNYGTDAATFRTFFRIGSSYSDSQSVSSLAAGDSVTVAFANWTPTQVGTFSKRCSTGLSGDQVRSNDTLSGSVTVRVKNVGVTAIVAPTGTIDSGAVVTPKARVKNYGTNAATFPVKFRIGSFYSDSQTVTNLAAGDSIQVSFTNWTATQRGISTTRCTTALSGDQNQGNDALSGSVTVKVTNVGVTAIIAPTGTIDSGTVVTPKARVKNYGTNAATFPVKFRIGSFYSDSQTVTSLAAGDSVQVSFTNWTATQRGTSTTRCTTALSGDQVRSDDTLSGSVTVRVTNVGVTTIVAPTGTIDSGTIVTPRARVKNYGTSAATFPVKFRIGSSYSDSQTVSNLASGDSIQVSFTNWTATQRGTSATRCTTALSGDQISGNDTLSGSVTVKVTDAGVTAIVAPTGSIDSGTVVTPKATVKNYGTNAATFPVKFRIGSFYSDSQTVSNLAAGNSVQVSFANWTASQRGTFTTRCTTALSSDQNRGNDTLSGSVTVKVTDVGVSSISAPAGTIDSGTVVTPKARVKNYGTSAASFPVKFRIGSSYSDSQTVSNLAAGDSIQVSFANWTATQRGTSTTRCTTALSGDQNQGNDALSGSVRVKVTNVGVTALVAPTDTVDSGAVITPKARVRNFGTDTASFRSFFRVGSVYSDSQSVSNLAAGDSTTVSFTNWTPTQLGAFTKRCSTGLSGDQVRSNDTLSGSVTVKRPTVIDVGVTAIVAPTGSVDSGTVVTPKARVKNFGTNTATFPVKFRIGSLYSDSQTVTSLAAGDSVQVSFTNWTATQRGTSATRCTTALSGDQHNNNDTLSGSVTVKVTNVGVVAIVAPSGPVDSGTVITPKAKVKNYGTSAATFPVKFRIGSFYTDSQTVSNLASGDSIQVSFANWTATQRGTSATRCTTALSGDQVRSNDTLSGTVRVRVTNVGVTTLVAPTDTVDSGAVITPKVRVRNFGTDTASFRSFFRVGSVYSDSQSVSNLAAGDSVMVSFTNWTPTQLGTFTKRCSTALSGDQVHANDTLSGSVTVRRPPVIDVGVTAIIAPTGTIDSGTVVAPKARVKNYGTSAATFPVKFRIGSFYSDSQMVSNLAAGDSIQVSFANWTATQRGTSATRCTTALSGDQHNNNDSLSGTVTVKVTNVGVTAIIAPTGTIDSGAVVTPKARVKNFGTNAATFPVKFSIGSSYTDSQTVSNLAAGDSATLSFTNWTAVQRGTNATRCSTALSDDQVRSNDTLSGTVRVKVTNVGVTALVAPSDTVDSGTVVTPKSRVKNYGTDAATFRTFFRIGSSYSDSQSVSSLAAGDSVTVAFANWTPTQVGTFNKRCSTGLSGDQVHANDTLSGSVTVKRPTVIDVGVTTIVAPTGTIDSGAVVTPKARVKNYGTNAATFPVKLRIGSFYSDSQTVSNLAAGDSIQVSFTNWAATQRGTSATRCTTALSGDQHNNNDSLSGTVTVKVTNVGVTAIVAPTGTIDSGTVVTPKAKVKNYGTSAATFPVKFRIGSFYSDSQTVSNLAAGDSIQVSFTNWTAAQRGSSATRCTTALSGDQVSNNDSLSGTVRVKVTNVGVAALIAPSGTVDSGTVVTPKAQVRNYGTDAVSFPVRFRIGSSYTDSQTVSNLAAGDSATLSFTNWTAVQRGTNVTRCSTALSGDQVRSNDTLSGTVRVRVTNVGVTTLVAPTDTVDSGAVITPKARVKNLGTDAATFPAFFRIGSTYADSQNVSSLAAGDSVMVSFTNWTPTQLGTFTKRCSTALSGDQVHANDTLSGSVTVRRPPVIDVGVTAIIAPTGTIDSGTVVAPKARVKNYGTSAATFPVKFRIGSFYSDSQMVSNLAAGDSIQVSFANWTATQRGTSATRCTTALSGDQHNNNDSLSGTVTVKVTNVGVTAIIAPAGTIDSGTVVTPKARVKNYGTSAASFPVKFRIGSSYSDSQTVSNLAAGDSVQVSFTNWTATQRGTSTTRCTTALSGDQNQGNDALSGSVRVKVTNVGVTALVAPTDTVDSGAVITPKARVRNFGTDTASFRSFFRVDAVYSDSQSVSNLAAGDSATVSFTSWTPTQLGTFAKRCSTALTGDQVRSNDTLSGSVTVVHAPVTDVGLTAIVAPTGTLDSGAVVTPKARVKNFGTNAATFPVRFRIGSFYSDSQTVSNLAAGDSIQVSFTNWTATQRGASATRCTTALSGDQNHSNDTLSGSVAVRVTDVGVQAIVAPTDTLDSGATVAPQARVRNYGTSAATFPVTFRVGAYADTQSVPNLAAGDSALVIFAAWTATARGPAATRCSTALSGDVNPANDTLSGSVTVRVRDVACTQILAPRDTVDSGTTVTPRAVVANVGTTSETFGTRFAIGGAYADTVSITLAAGATDTIAFGDWTALESGTFPTSCAALLAADMNRANDSLLDSVVVPTYTGVAELQVLPRVLALERPKPDPMRGRATIRFSIPHRAHASVTIRSATGALVRILIGPQSLAPNTYSLTWDGRDDRGRRMAPGVYFWRLECEGKILTRKAIKID